MNMAKLWKLLLLSTTLLFSTSFVLAQNVTVSATVMDPTGQLFIYGTYNIQFVRNSSSSVPAADYAIGGNVTQRVQLGPYSGNLDAGGSFSTTLVNGDSHMLTPGGSQWQVTVCPNVGAGGGTGQNPVCTTITLPLYGSTINISTQLNAATPVIQVTGLQPMATAYQDTEVNATKDGSFYFNTAGNATKVLYRGTWYPIGGGGGGTAVSINSTAVGSAVNFNNTTPAASGSTYANVQFQYNGAGQASAEYLLGLADPGANGIVTRTAPYTTADATYVDIDNLFTGCTVGQVLEYGNGLCLTITGGGNVSTTGGTVRFLPEWTNATTLGNSPVEDVAAGGPGGNGSPFMELNSGYSLSYGNFGASGSTVRPYTSLDFNTGGASTFTFQKAVPNPGVGTYLLTPATTSDTDIGLYLTMQNGYASNTSQILLSGEGLIQTDGAVTQGHVIGESVITGGQGHDLGASPPPNTWFAGYALWSCSSSCVVPILWAPGFTPSGTVVGTNPTTINYIAIWANTNGTLLTQSQAYLDSSGNFFTPGYGQFGIGGSTSWVKGFFGSAPSFVAGSFFLYGISGSPNAIGLEVDGNTTPTFFYGNGNVNIGSASQGQLFVYQVNSQQPNIATSTVCFMCLAKGDQIGWRNQANSSNDIFQLCPSEDVPCWTDLAVSATPVPFILGTKTGNGNYVTTASDNLAGSAGTGVCIDGSQNLTTSGCTSSGIQSINSSTSSAQTLAATSPIVETDSGSGNSVHTFSCPTCAVTSSHPTRVCYMNIDDTAAVTLAESLVSQCYNDFGATLTVIAVRCFTDNSGSTTVSPKVTGGSNLLSSTLTCSPSWTSGTLSGTPTFTTGSTFDMVATPDGTSKLIHVEVTLQ